MANQALSILKHFIWSLINEYEVVAFYPYTSICINRIVEQHWGHEMEDIDPQFKEFFDKIAKEIEEKGARLDNKIVFELARKTNKKGYEEDFIKESNIFVGWYDNNISIGFGVYQEKYYHQYTLYLNRETGKLERHLRKVKLLERLTSQNGNSIEKDSICSIISDWGRPVCDIVCDSTNIRINCVSKNCFEEIEF